MAFGWKMLVPLSFLNIVLVGAALFYGLPMWSLALLSVVTLGLAFYIIRRRAGTRAERATVRVVSARELRG